MNSDGGGVEEWNDDVLTRGSGTVICNPPPPPPPPLLLLLLFKASVSTWERGTDGSRGATTGAGTGSLLRNVARFGTTPQSTDEPEMVSTPDLTRSKHS